MDTGLNAVKTGSNKVVHRAGEFLGNKIADAIAKSNNYKVAKTDKNPRNVEKINVSPEKRDQILKKNFEKYYKNGTL